MTRGRIFDGINMQPSPVQHGVIQQTFLRDGSIVRIHDNLPVVFIKVDVSEAPAATCKDALF